jgi:hypothetical protein
MPGCNAVGQTTGDVARVQGIVTALQYRINSARMHRAEQWSDAGAAARAAYDAAVKEAKNAYAAIHGSSEAEIALAAALAAGEGGDRLSLPAANDALPPLVLPPAPPLPQLSRMPPVETLPVYISCISAGCTMGAILLPHLQVRARTRYETRGPFYHI